MKRTLLITLEYPPYKGGVAAVYANLINYLPKDRIHVLCHSTEKRSMDGVTRTPFFTSLFWPRWLPAIYRTLQIIIKEKIDMIWVGQVLPLGTVALFIHRAFRVPYFVTIHGMDITMVKKRSRKGLLMKRILQNAKFVTTNSHFTAEQIRGYGVKEERIVYVYPCPNTTPRGPVEKLIEKQPDQHIILCVARLVKRKGQDKLIEALPHILKRAPNTYLWIAGEGPDGGYLRKLAEKSGVKNHIRFFGCVSDAELRGLYEEADLFAMPSRKLKNNDVEGFGIVYLEANMFKLPVVGGNTGGVPDAVQEGVSGYLVNAEDIDAITQRILYLIQNPDIREKIGMLAKNRAETQFQWQTQAETLKKHLL